MKTPIHPKRPRMTILRDLFDNIPVGIGVADPVKPGGNIPEDTRVVYFNKEWKRLFGFDAKMVKTVGEAIQRLYPEPTLRERMSTLRHEALKRRQDGLFDKQIEARAMGAGGQWMDILTGTAVFQGMLIVSMVDITVRDRIKEVAQTSVDATFATAEKIDTRIPIRRGGSAVRLIDKNSILAVVGDGKYSRVINGSDEHLDARSLGQWQAILDKIGFERIDNSTLLCLNKVVSLFPFGRGAYISFNDSANKIEIGRTGRKRLESFLALHPIPSK